MDLSAAITIERPGQSALDINSIRDPLAVGSAPLSGYSVEQVDFSGVAITAFVEDIPQADGVDASDPYLGGRSINMVVSVYGNSYADFWDKMNDLNYALQAQTRYATGTALPFDGMRKLSFTQPSAAGTASLYMNVRPVALPRFVTEKSSAAGITAKGYAVTVNVSLFAEDPYKYAVNTATFSRTGSGTISVVNNGNTVAWPTVTWGLTTGTPVSATLGSDTVSHSAFGSNITDDFKTAVSTSPTTLTGFAFFSIPPGTSSVSVVGQSGKTIIITIREALL